MGTADYLDDTVGEVVPHSLIPGETGMVCDVAVEDLSVALRAIRGRWREKGQRARERMNYFSQTRFSRSLYGIAVKYGIIE